MTTADAQEWTLALESSRRVEIMLGKGRLVLLLVLSTLFVVLGAAIVATSSGAFARAMGVAAILFFGLGVVVFVRQLLRTGPSVVVDDQGIHSPDRGVSVPWEAARSAFVFSQSRTHLVQVEVDPHVADAYYAQHRGLGLARNANRALMGGREALSLPAPLAVDPFAFATWLDGEIRKRNPGLTPGQP